MQSSLDSGTLSQFGCNKGVVRSTLRALCFLAGSFTYKTGRPICLCTGCGHKVRIPSLEYSEDPRCGVLHRERLTTNTKHDSSVHVSEKEGNYGSLREVWSNKSLRLRCRHKKSSLLLFKAVDKSLVLLNIFLHNLFN